MDIKFYCRLLTAAFLLCLPFQIFGQLPVCVGSGEYVYMLGAGDHVLYNFDPSLPVSGTNPLPNTITMPEGSSGIVVSNNLNSGTPSPTFYTTVFSDDDNLLYYYYHNGTTWVNTNHSVGSTFASNPAGAGSFIYNLVGSTGEVYKYDGTGTGTLLITISDFDGAGPWDLQGDCEGNFYILKYVATSLGPAWLRKYSPTGALLQSWTVTNGPLVNTTGGGFGIIGNQVFFENNTLSLYTGTLDATTVTFGTPQPDLFSDPQDFGTCPLCDNPIDPILQADKDTVYICDYNMLTGTTVIASGVGPFTWNVIQGAATITPNTGPTVVITPLNTGVTRVELGTASNPNKDTVTFIVPTATVNAGPDDTLRGCGLYLDTIYANLSNTLAGINYTYSWSPSAAILSGVNTLTPFVQPDENTSFILAVSSPANQGGCTWRDTTIRYISTEELNLSLSYLQEPCGGEVNFIPGSSDTSGILYLWDFGDGATSVTAASSHQYALPGIFTVTLSGQVGLCRDTITQEITVSPATPLIAEATSDTAVCAGDAVPLTVTTATTYQWSPAAGLSSAQEQSPLAMPLVSTWYFVTITDAAGCAGTDSVLITVLPAPEVTASDDGTPIDCTHPSTTLHAVGATTYIWTPGRLCDDSTSADPVVSPTQTTLFIVAGSNGTCVARDSILVPVHQSGTVVVPNAFTPNNDSRNDLIRPLSYCGFVVESFRIFNRFGEQVFYTTKAGQGWDGIYNSLPADIGTYWYYLTGRDGRGKEVLLKGDIELIR